MKTFGNFDNFSIGDLVEFLLIYRHSQTMMNAGAVDCLLRVGQDCSQLSPCQAFPLHFPHRPPAILPVI